ncbi:fructose-bisphosphate aldolase class I [Candidatus Saccharibacteria bacterium]|nr:fructose-bisphosphate aldolase class I [Candidatus Saccharibacteria bacterium]
MNILIVGNILKDIYLNLDSRSEPFETDKNSVKWLNLSFDASSHRFFSRSSSFSGAAVTLEVLRNLGLNAEVVGSSLDFESEASTEAKAHRYILVSDNTVSYFTPSTPSPTDFVTPEISVDYLYIDRSANLTPEASSKISAYLDTNPNAKLVIYLKDFTPETLTPLISRANLVFLEDNPEKPAISYAPLLKALDPKNIIRISEKRLSTYNMSENLSISRVDVQTHLSAFSIASATILGCFILGKSVEESLELARINTENSKLNASLSLEKLEELMEEPSPDENLELIAKSLVLPGKGILAADESGGSIKKKFEKLGIEDTYDNRRSYRNIFFTTPKLEEFASGVILFDETARQLSDDGRNFVDFLISRRIIPGIKVDQGLEPFEKSEETYTKGLDGLEYRLADYYDMGLRFAKWRSAFEIRLDDNGNLKTPTNRAIEKNCTDLATYARACQSAGLVPIVEPEVVYDGLYDINKSAAVTSKILDCLFESLSEAGVNLRACLLKVNMILAGKQSEAQSTPEEVGLKTAEILKTHVPKNLAGVVFLSGGQSAEQATDNLAAVEKNGPFPWPVTFSFARALQDPALYTWRGRPEYENAARAAFLARLMANARALNPNNN